MQGKRFQPGWIHAESAQHVIGDEKDCAAVDASGKTDTDRRFVRQAQQPHANFLCQGGDVRTTDLLAIVRLRMGVGEKKRVHVGAGSGHPTSSISTTDAQAPCGCSSGETVR